MSGNDTDNQGTNATEYWMLERNPSKNVPPIDAQQIWTDFLDVTKDMMMSVVWFYNQSVRKKHYVIQGQQILTRTGKDT